MKFFGAILAYLGFGLLIGGGILLLAAHGQVWLLLLAFAAYAISLYKFGIKPN